MNDITITLRDEAHLLAHVDHFAVPLETALGWVKDQLTARVEHSGWAHFDFICPQVVGLTGLLDVGSESGGFWARRRGRSIPSHLVVGDKAPTTRLCVWGFWQDETTFVLHTLYPGRVAPREIHDPELPVSVLPEALAFWTRNAIVVEPGEWEE